MSYANGVLRSRPVTKRITSTTAASGNRVITTSYSTAVNPSEASKGVLKSASSTETPIDVTASTGSGRGRIDYGVVGQYVVQSDGTTKFVPNENFNRMPQDVKNQVSGSPATAKQAINTAATDSKLTNNLSTRGSVAPPTAAPTGTPPAGGTGGTNQPGSSSSKPYAGAAGGAGTRYPLKMKDDQDYIIFKREEGDEVILGIQAGISDSNRVSWGESRLDAIKMAAARGAQELVTADNYAETGGDLMEKAAKGIDENLKTASGSAFAKNYFVEKALSLQTGELTGRNEFGGAILNPNLELIFNGPSLRTFSFTFRLTPREPAEAKVIKKIINFFKANMVPRADGLFLRRPYYFDIKYKGTGASSINKIKKNCALQSCSVQYTPDGSYVTYIDGSMTAYTLTLEFSETTPLTSVDYEGVNDSEITY
jgi:hypothetical protein